MKRNTQIRIHRKKRKPEPLRAYAKTKQRERTAYHEAGHAVAALVQNLWFRSVTIKRDEEYLGAIFHPNIFLDTSTVANENAGASREPASSYCMRAGRPKNYSIRTPRNGDRTATRRVHLIFPDNTAWCPAVFPLSGTMHIVPFCADYKRRPALIRAHWQTVKAIASALLKDRTLNDEQANKIAATVRASNTRKDGNS